MKGHRRAVRAVDRAVRRAPGGALPPPERVVPHRRRDGRRHARRLQPDRHHGGRPGLAAGQPGLRAG